MAQASEQSLDRTPFHDIHVALGAKMVPFAGFEMPVQYPTGITAEHLAVRTACGLFDVSQTRGGSRRTAIVLHQGDGDLAATVLNALDPDSAETRFYSGLVYEGITP